MEHNYKLHVLSDSNLSNITPVAPSGHDVLHAKY